MTEQSTLNLGCLHSCGGIAYEAMKREWAIDKLKKELAEGRAGQLNIQIKVTSQRRNEHGNLTTETIIYGEDVTEPDDGAHGLVVEHIIAALAENKQQIESSLRDMLTLSGFTEKTSDAGGAF